MRIDAKTVGKHSKTVVRSANQFNKLLGEISLIEKERFKEVAVTSTVEVWKNIIHATPADTGRARANWQIGTERLDAEVDKAFPKSSGNPHTNPPASMPTDPEYPNEAKMKAMEGARYLWIFNNLPYIEQLEAGSSKQSSPGNMVAGSIIGLNKIFKKKLKESIK